MNNYNTTLQPITINTVINAILRALVLVVIYLGQQFGKAVNWLNARHDMSNEEGEIHLTGWQYLGIIAALAFVALVISCASI